MKKTIIGAVSVLTAMLAGCSNSATELNYPVRPTELKDCRIYLMTNDSGREITVARCPNSTTTTNYKQGKTTAAVIVVDGVEYVMREK